MPKSCIQACSDFGTRSPDTPSCRPFGETALASLRTRRKPDSVAPRGRTGGRSGKRVHAEKRHAAQGTRAATGRAGGARDRGPHRKPRHQPGQPDQRAGDLRRIPDVAVDRARGAHGTCAPRPGGAAAEPKRHRHAVHRRGGVRDFQHPRGARGPLLSAGGGERAAGELARPGRPLWGADAGHHRQGRPQCATEDHRLSDPAGARRLGQSHACAPCSRASTRAAATSSAGR